MKIQHLIQILRGGPDWANGISFTSKALKQSFAALMLCVPFFIIITRAVVKFNDNSTNAPYSKILLVLSLMVLSFPMIAYFLSMAFNKASAFRPWVTVRNWAYMWMVLIIALGFGLYLLDLLPFSFAYIIGLTVYLGTLVLDIRLAQTIANFDWAGSVFAAIIISMTSMMVLFLGLTQILA